MSDEERPSSLSEADHQLLTSLVRDVPNWPKPGVMFKDITPLLADPRAFEIATRAIAELGRGADGTPQVDAVAGIEARGFILAAPVAQLLGVSFVPVRKAGKLPYETVSASYELEYGQETIEVHADAFAGGGRVLVVDDVLATGGTVEATVQLIEATGAHVAAVAVLIELGFLGGRSRLGTLDVKALLAV